MTARKRAWVCTGCFAAWIFEGQYEAAEAEDAARRHRCEIEGATTVIVEADMIADLAARFGRGRSKPS